jgi:hypothetical protein
MCFSDMTLLTLVISAVSSAAARESYSTPLTTSLRRVIALAAQSTGAVVVTIDRANFALLHEIVLLCSGHVLGPRSRRLC